MKNELSDLNNYLFQQLERLNNDDLNQEQLEKEVLRAKSITGVASSIIEIGNLAVSAKKTFNEYGNGNVPRHLSLEQKPPLIPNQEKPN